MRRMQSDEGVNYHTVLTRRCGRIQHINLFFSCVFRVILYVFLG